LIVQYLAFSFA